MANFETTDYSQMRRCRMAFLRDETVDEIFEGGRCASGFVHAIRPDLTCWPLRWTVTVDSQLAEPRIKALQEEPAT